MQQKATNVVWHNGHIKQEDRENLLKQKGAVLWFTGLSGSGKSTIAVAIEKKLFAHGHLAYRLDGDNIRHGLNKDLGFSQAEREENIRRIGEVSKLFADAGIIAMTSFISPYRKDREIARKLMPEGKFFEIYVKCNLAECEKRDPKGMYKKARAGEIKNFTGVDDPYEEPFKPELILETDKMSLEEEVAKVWQLLQNNNIIKG